MDSSPASRSLEQPPVALRGLATFDAAFTQRARRVRLRVLLHGLLGGLTSGAVVALPFAALAWWTRHGALRLGALACLAVGTAVARFALRGRRWSDADVALFLDEKLRSDEAIVTALGLRDRTTPPAKMVVKAAMAALARELPKGSGPRVVRVWHLLAPIGCVATLWIARLELPPAALQPPPPPGTDTVALENLEGLDEARALAKLAPGDAAQHERLRAIAERAERLKSQLAKGMPRREAQAELSRLRDDVAAERQRLGAGEERRGLEAALAKLANEAPLDAAGRALGDRDLTQFDDEMEKLANRLEGDDRERAKKTLEEAADAARREGAKDVAKSLEEQKKRPEARAEGAEALRELAKSLGEGLSPEGKRALEEMGKDGSPQDRAELGRELAKALEGLSDTEKKRVAEKLKARARELGEKGREGKTLEHLQRDLATPDGQKGLADALKELAQEPTESEVERRDRALGDAARELGQGESRLQQPGLVPVPIEGGSGAPGNAGGSKDPGRAGVSRGGERGEHGAGTKAVDGDGLRARAAAKLNPGAPNAGSVVGRTPGRTGETARTGGTGRLGEAAPGELSGVERSGIPREYREQVGRYFPAR